MAWQAAGNMGTLRQGASSQLCNTCYNTCSQLLPVDHLPCCLHLQHGQRAARSPFTLPADASSVGEPGGPRPRLTLTFPDAAVPSRLVWVLHAPGADAWVREQGTDFTALLRPPTLGDVVSGVLGAEGSATHWSLLHRLQRALEVMDTAAGAGERGGGGAGVVQVGCCGAAVWAWNCSSRRAHCTM
jgi:hypothetical protein